MITFICFKKMLIISNSIAYITAIILTIISVFTNATENSRYLAVFMHAGKTWFSEHSGHAC